MIILDTNVISELMRPEPKRAVREWMDAQVAETMFLTSVTMSELLYGVAVMPEGKRKHRFLSYTKELKLIFEGRILAFDLHAAERYAHLALAAKRTGRGLPLPDGYIAAIAAAHKFAIATRDTVPFADVGLTVIDPFIYRWR
jgi:toxin FitB